MSLRIRSWFRCFRSNQLRVTLITCTAFVSAGFQGQLCGQGLSLVRRRFVKYVTRLDTFWQTGAAVDSSWSPTLDADSQTVSKPKRFRVLIGLVLVKIVPFDLRFGRRWRKPILKRSSIVFPSIL